VNDPNTSLVKSARSARRRSTSRTSTPELTTQRTYSPRTTPKCDKALLASPDLTGLLLEMMRSVEDEPSLLGASSHILTIAVRRIEGVGGMEG
ncbi:hypothetical protein E1258_23490, partial [Micromonospora sp. KC207]